MTLRFFAFVLMVLLWGTSCSTKDTVFFKKIYNKSSKDITFYFHGGFNPQTYGDSIFVAAGQLKEIYTYTEENSSVSAPQACRIYNDSVTVVISGGGVLNKRLQDESGWAQTSEEVNQICTFWITDSDIL